MEGVDEVGMNGIKRHNCYRNKFKAKSEAASKFKIQDNDTEQLEALKR